MRPDRDILSNRDEELELLVLELADVKDVLRELSRQLLRIERRIRAVLPRPKGSAEPVFGGLFDERAAGHQIARLTERAKNGEQIERELRRMTVRGQLSVLARELGMTNTTLPTKDELIRRISTRLRQKVSVASGIREGVDGGGERVG